MNLNNLVTLLDPRSEVDAKVGRESRSELVDEA